MECPLPVRSKPYQALLRFSADCRPADLLLSALAGFAAARRALLPVAAAAESAAVAAPASDGGFATRRAARLRSLERAAARNGVALRLLIPAVQAEEGLPGSAPNTGSGVPPAPAVHAETVLPGCAPSPAHGPVPAVQAVEGTTDSLASAVPKRGEPGPGGAAPCLRQNPGNPGSGLGGGEQACSSAAAAAGGGAESCAGTLASALAAASPYGSPAAVQQTAAVADIGVGAPAKAQCLVVGWDYSYGPYPVVTLSHASVQR